MRAEVKSSILKTLIYGDIFDYPLTKEELWRFLISRGCDRQSFAEALTEFPPVKWEHENGFYFLSGRKKILEGRNKRKKVSKKKLRFTRRIIHLLSFVPTVLLIGISGNLAMENSEKKDDIDLFVIASKGNLWFTRLTLILILILIGQYRYRGKTESQRFCLNMLLDENALALSKNRQNLYTAHEVVQLLPVFERDITYKKFLNANLWVQEFLPNSLDIKGHRVIKSVKKKLSGILISKYLEFFEPLVKTIQLLHMEKHITSETVSDHFLAFHPFEYKNYVLKEYKKHLKKYKLSSRLTGGNSKKLVKNETV